MSGLLSIHSYSYNPCFHELISWFGIKSKQTRFGYFFCDGFEDLKYLYMSLYHLNDAFRLEGGREVLDRTETIKFPYKIHYLAPWKIPTSYVAYKDCCDLVAQKLNSKNYDLYSIFWSGGLDSTCMLVALLKNIEFFNEKIEIYFSQESINENPSMYELLCKMKVKMIKMDYMFDFESIKGHIVTGDPGDAININFSKEERMTNNFQESWHDQLIKKKLDLNVINWLETFLKKSGKEIKNVAEAKYWLNLITRKQSIELHPLHYNLSIKLGNYTAFYSDELFENWSYYNVEQFYKCEPKQYKLHQKNYISEFHKNENYNSTKVKGMSTFLFSASNRKNIFNNIYYFIDSSGNKIQTNSLPFTSKQEFFKKYGNQFDYIFYK